MPYADKRYDLKAFNPTPNELAFLGGLGKPSGNTLSKAHVQRPSMNQILFQMRTANRILFTFSEDPVMTHTLTRKQLDGFKSPKKQLKKRSNNVKIDLIERISKIQIADNVIKSSSESRSHRTSLTSESDDLLQRGAPVEITAKIDTGLRKKSSSTGIGGAAKKISFAFKATDVFKVPPPPPIQPEKSFREWALEEREKRAQAIQQVSLQQIKQEREANEIFPKSKNSKLPKIFLSGQRKGRKDQIEGAEHLAGAMFGKFIENTGPDEIMASQNKFHVPLSMFSRAEVETKKNAMNRKKLIKARLDYMKIPQIASDSDGEQDANDDVLEDHKELSFVRTPFNSLIPTVHHGKISRIERLKTGTSLRRNRLKRINLLLYDRKVSSAAIAKSPDEAAEAASSTFSGELDEEFQLPEIETENQQQQFDSEYRQHYHEYLHDKYLEQLEHYNENLNQKLNTLNEQTASIRASSATPIERKSFRDFIVAELSSAAPVAPTIAPPDSTQMKDPAFKKVKRKILKNMRFSRTDIREGELYFDPFLLEKVHNPEKGLRIVKNYTSLMRMPSKLRKRLQVNAASFDEERCGNFYHLLVTEWDQFYISEIRHRPKVQKFCVKSDIIRIREMVRKKFFLFFMQEDLMKLFAEQEIENEMINKTTKFIKVKMDRRMIKKIMLGI